MHPLVEDVDRPDPIPMCAIATRTTAIGSARHLVKMATARTRLGRVRFADLNQGEMRDHKNGKFLTTATLRLLYRFIENLARLFASTRLARQGGGPGGRRGLRWHPRPWGLETSYASGLGVFGSQ